jgi:Thiamine pyrophosphate enzyme, N-terminal TPP binding domain
VSGALCPQTSADRARSCTRIQSWAFASAGMSTKPPRMERCTITAQAGRSSLAVGDTEMTDWRIVQQGDGANPTLVVPERTYVLQPGDAHCYDVGMVHSRTSLSVQRQSGRRLGTSVCVVRLQLCVSAVDYNPAIVGQLPNESTAVIIFERPDGDRNYVARDFAVAVLLVQAVPPGTDSKPPPKTMSRVARSIFSPCRQGESAAPHDGLHEFDRPWRNKHGDGGGRRACQSTPAAALAGDVFASRRPDPVLQQIQGFGDPTVSVNDCFRPFSRWWDRITRPEQILESLPQALRVLTDPPWVPTFLAHAPRKSGSHMTQRSGRTW